MDISIREYIKNNFKDSSEDDIRLSIEDGVNSTDEIVLPGLGVFLNILWINSNDEQKQQILTTLKNNL